MISDQRAQRIASDWHGGGGSALYVFASTGAIDRTQANEEVKACMRSVMGKGGPEFTTLNDLACYLWYTGSRGPVEDWYTRVICAN